MQAPISQSGRAAAWQDVLPRLKLIPVLRRTEHRCSTRKAPTHTAEKLSTCCIFTQAVVPEGKDRKLLTMQSLCRDVGYKLLMRASVETQHVMSERAQELGCSEHFQGLTHLRALALRSQ